MPTSTRRERLDLLQRLLEACHKNEWTYRTPAIYERVMGLMAVQGFGVATNKDYVRTILAALEWEVRNKKEFQFAA